LFVFGLVSICVIGALGALDRQNPQTKIDQEQRENVVNS